MQIPKKQQLSKMPIPLNDIHVKLDAETYKRVESLAREEDRPISAMARRIITLWLNGEKHAKP